MSTIKTKMAKESVVIFLTKLYGEDVSSIEFMVGGESSQAFSFQKKDEDFIIRINKRLNGFEKDKYAFENFSNKNVPIPKIIEIGKFNNEHHYAISEKAQGQILDNLSDEEYKKVFPELFDILTSIHNIDITNTQGYGYWAIDGTTESKSWKDYVLNVNKYVVVEDNKPSLFETSFLEEELWNKVYKKIESLLQYCPEDRYIMHGDYGYDNVTSENSSITGVFDWEGSKYGDFLYDVAWLNFWNPKRNPLSFFENYYTNTKPIKNFKERVLCYQLRIGLSSLSFYAFSCQKEKYDSAKVKLVGLF